MPSALEGAPMYVRGTGRSASIIPISIPKDQTSILPPSYTTIFPISPPNSPPTSPSLFSNKSTTSPIALSPCTIIKPLLTPRSSEENITLDTNIISALFPGSSPIHKLPSTAIELSDVVEKWTGAVVENPALGTRTLYVLVGGSYQDVTLRESVCGVMEKAEEDLGCNGVVMCLEKNTPDLGDLLHSLMYVGGTITSQPFAANPAYILVGLDL